MNEDGCDGMKKLWKCQKCKREFEKKGQTHSCNLYPVSEHLKGKEKIAKPLYNELKEKIRENIGPFKVESLPCCIHFVSSYTFAAVYAMKDKIRIHFSLNKKLASSRLRSQQFSASRYMYELSIKDKKELDAELIGWLKLAYRLRRNR